MSKKQVNVRLDDLTINRIKKLSKTRQENGLSHISDADVISSAVGIVYAMVSIDDEFASSFGRYVRLLLENEGLISE